MGSRNSDTFSEGNHDLFVGVWHCRFKAPKFFKRLTFPTTLEPHSKTYVSWLLLVTLAFMYNATVIPLRGVFPYQTKENISYWFIADYICDFIYILDILIFKVRLRFAKNGIVVSDRKETKKHYVRKWMFKLDILALTPLDFLYLLDSVGVNPWLRLPRLLKIQTFWEFYERCDQASRSTQHAIRIIKTMTYMLYLIHIETCGYYAMSVYEGIGTNRWVYNGSGIAYVRCFYLATKTATSIGNNPKPTNQLEYGFMTLYWLSGVFVFALLIGQIRDIVEAAGLVKDSYRKKMDACLWYMQSINLPREMQDRVREWFLYNWEQQKTIDERDLVSALPRKLQTDLAINVHFNTLSKVQLFQDCEKNLLYDLVLKLKPILYLPGDYICQKGEVGKEMYIVTQGQVEVVGGENNQTVLATLHEGSVFGEISLLAMSGRGNRRTADVRCKGYTNVFTLSKHDFERAMTEYPEAQSLLKRRAKKLLKANAKMEKKTKTIEAEEIIRTPPGTPKLLQTVIQVMDPDSNVVKQLTPHMKKAASMRSTRRPVSRSQSHRLSASPSSQHHLTPPRSHSYRHSQAKLSIHSLDAIPIQKEVVQHKSQDNLDSDNQDDVSVFQDSSDDISLSEILHDTEAISSFDDDDDDEFDELLIIEKYETDPDQSINSDDWRETLPPPPPPPPLSPDDENDDDDDRGGGGGGEEEEEEEEGGGEGGGGGGGEGGGGGGGELRENVSRGDKEEVRKGDERKESKGDNGEDGGKSERSKWEGSIPSEDSQDSGIPNVQRSDSRSSSGKNDNGTGSDSRRGSKSNSRNSGRDSGGSEPERPGELEHEDLGSVEEDIGDFTGQKVTGVLRHEDSIEDYIEKQRWPVTATPAVTDVIQSPVGGVFRVDVTSAVTGKTGPEDVLSGCGGVSGRARKMSVVSPPLSPIQPRSPVSSPREKSAPGHWGAPTPATTSATQLLTFKGNHSDLIVHCFTPVETVPVRPLPHAESSSSLAAASSQLGASLPNDRPQSRHHTGATLTNGLESCCGGGPLIEIPPENRITCAVEIHRQKSITTSTPDIHGHTETTL